MVSGGGGQLVPRRGQVAPPGPQCDLLEPGLARWRRVPEPVLAALLAALLPCPGAAWLV